MLSWWAPGAVAWAVGLWLGALAAAPRFDPPQVLGNQVRLRLRGEAGREYRIETSLDLLAWTASTSGVAVGGVLETMQLLSDRQAGRFFRGREVAGSGAGSPPTVVPHLDDRLAASAVLTPEAGGSLHLVSPEGVEFNLRLGRNAVFSPTLVRLTLLTNLTGVPAARGFMAGVLLEPEGLPLAAPGFLEVTYPTNLPNPRVASYSFDKDGRNFHLTPDLVVTNGVRILVQQFRGYGSGEFSLTELNAVAGAAASPASVIWRPNSPRLLASLEECYPDQRAEAQALRRQLTESLRPLLQDMELDIARERQNEAFQFQDQRTHGTGVPDAMARFQDWYAQNLTPQLLANARQKCLVGAELLAWGRGFELQRQIMGVAGEGFGDADFMAGLTDQCQNQILDCCRSHGPDRNLVLALIENQKRRELMEPSPDGGSSSTVSLADCLPLWFGTIEYTESERTNYSKVTSDMVWSGDVERTYRLFAIVDRVEEDVIQAVPSFGIPGSTNLTFHFSAVSMAAVRRDLRERTQGDLCTGEHPTPGGGQPGLASARLQDWVVGYQSQKWEDGSATNLLSFDAWVVMADGTGGAFAPETSLLFSVDPQSVPIRGAISRVDGVVEGFDCLRKTKGSTYAGRDTFEGIYVDARKDEFIHLPREVRFNTHSTNGPLVRELKVHLQRRK